MKAYKLVDQPNKTLPSNSTFREDLIYRRMDDLVKGQVIFSGKFFGLIFFL